MATEIEKDDTVAGDMENMTYSRALAELEQILSQLRSETCDVDTLGSRTRRAASLLQFCRSRLTATGEELASVLARLEQPAE